jgi:hypothetical protein
MSIEQLEAQLLSMPAADRREFARWFYDNERQFIGDERQGDLSPEMRSELIRRREELRANPGLAVPITDEWFESLKKKLRNASVSQASAR